MCMWTMRGCGSLWTMRGCGSLWTLRGHGSVWTMRGCGSLWTVGGVVGMWWSMGCMNNPKGYQKMYCVYSLCTVTYVLYVRTVSVCGDILCVQNMHSSCD